MSESGWAALAQIALLALWLGAAVLFAMVVAPAAFAVLPTRGLAGELVGRVLPVVFWAGMAVGLLCAALEWRATPPSRARLVGSLLVAVACALSHLVVGGRIERLRAQIGGAVDALALDDARRVLFGRLHAVSVLGLGLAMLAGLVVLVLAARAARR
ncbi:MAG TPA: DUF4149 domain-containing protein [Gemmatimonadaceae bacterium]|nr:DUF4149 domain-containing protein [Gemmatimonadaceae bacterium]